MKQFIYLTQILFILLASISPTFGQQKEEQQKITSPTPANANEFGAAVSISGDYAVIGEKTGDYGSAGSNTGLAYVYYNNAGTWELQATLHASDSGYGDEFGASVDIDGDYVIVGAPGWDDPNASNSGAAYIYKKPTSGWVDATETVRYYMYNEEADAQFGFSVGISQNYAIVGVPYLDYTGTDRGQAHIYKKGTNWAAALFPNNYLQASDRIDGDKFGYSVSITDDHAMVGNSEASSSTTSHVYAYENNSDAWDGEQILEGSALSGGAYFGCDLEINGTDAIIGAYYNSCAFIYRYNGTDWVEVIKLTSPTSGNLFGFSVGLSDTHAVVGALYDDEKANNAGAAYVYRKTGTYWTSITDPIKLMASDGAATNYFGSSVGISENHVIVGANAFNSYTGQVYLFGYPAPPTLNPTSNILYVGTTSAGNKDGASWANRIGGNDEYFDQSGKFYGSHLKYAMDNVASGTEIWVTSGTFKPATMGDKSVYFKLKEGVALYGGFQSFTSDRNDRHYVPETAALTILSGDLDGDDGSYTGFPTSVDYMSDNSEHIVYYNGSLTNTTILDGFTVQGGYGDVNGAGLALANDANAIIRNCTFKKNYGRYGGAVAITSNSEPLIEHNIFDDNYCTTDGAAIYVTTTNATINIKNNRFVNNTATRLGGAIRFNTTANVVLENNTFENNSSGDAGGAIYSSGYYPTITNNTIINNTADNNGGGISASTGTYTNNTITGNHADNDDNGSGYGGGIYATNTTYLKNNIIANNYTGSGTTSDDYYNTGTSTSSYNVIKTSNVALDATDITDITNLNLAASTSGNFPYTLEILTGSIAMDNGDDETANNGVAIPTTDQQGNAKRRLKDIGSFESQGAIAGYWLGSYDNDWNRASNWDDGLIPANSADIILNDKAYNYRPILNNQEDITCASVTLIKGGKFSVSPGASLDITGNLDIQDGAIISYVAETQVASIRYQNLINNNDKAYIYQFIDFADANRYYYFTPMMIDAQSASDLGSEFTLYDYNTIGTAWNPISTTINNNLYAGKGYAAKRSTGGSHALVGKINELTDFSGVLQNGGDNWNLIGNPMTCGLHWDAAYTYNATDVGSTIWYRTSLNTDPLVRLFDSFDAETNIGTNNNGAGAVTAIVSPGQAFWVKVTGASPNITIDNLIKAKPDQGFYKEVRSDVFRLRVMRDIYPDELIVTFMDEATMDNDKFDAEKRFNTDEKIPQVYTNAGDENVVINAVPLLETYMSLPIVFNTEIEGIHVFDAYNITEFDADIQVYLEDKQEIKFTNLRENTYEFYSDIKENDASRFVLHFYKNSSTTTDISDFVNSNEPTIFAFENNIHISNTTKHFDLSVYDIHAKLVYSEKNISNGCVVNYLESGLYLVKLTQESKVITKKVIIQ